MMTNWFEVGSAETDLKLSTYLAQLMYVYWGKCSKPHTCGENGKLLIYLFFCLYGTCEFRKYILPYLCTLPWFIKPVLLMIKRQDQQDRKAEQWESTQQGLKNGEESMVESDY